MMLILTSLAYWIMPDKTHLYYIASIFAAIELIGVMIAGSFVSGLAFVGLFPILVFALINQVVYKKVEDDEEEYEE